MTEYFAQPDDNGELRASELHSSLSESLGAQAGEAFMSGSRTLGRIVQYANAGGTPMAGFNMPDVPSMADIELNEQIRNSIPDVAMADAKARVKQEGLDGQFKLPDQDSIKGPVLDLMIQHAHERREYDAAVSRGPHGFFPDALGFMTSIGAGVVDPVNAAAFSIPVLGEARAGMLVARAGESIMARAGTKGVIGAAQGAVGGAALAPAEWWLHTRDGQDYTMADALHSVVMSAGMGAAFHAGFGAVGDAAARLRGRPLKGSPADLLERGLMHGTHLPGEALADDGLHVDEVPGITTPTGPAEPPEGIPPGPVPAHPAEILADLPQRAQEDVVRSAIADVVNDRPVRAGELLQESAKADPRIAKSVGVDAYHGSAFDFDRFDAAKIDSGEGAQSYGHGLYFAQNEGVARTYAKSVPARDFIRKAQELYSEFDSPGEAHEAVAESKDFTPAQKRLLQALEKDDWLGFDYPHQAVSAALGDPKNFDLSPETVKALEQLGHVYKVRINANAEHFLDWDKPLAEQSPHVLAVLRGIADERDPGSGDRLAESSTKAGDWFEAVLGRDADGSRKLHEAGVAGIKYLDAKSRNSGGWHITPPDQTVSGKWMVKSSDYNSKGLQFETEAEARAALAEKIAGETRNFVVFNDADVRITHKNGVEVGLDEVKAAQAHPGPEGRVPFDDKFPNVVVQRQANSKVRVREHPDYEAAKAGDTDAAARVVTDVIDPAKVDKIRALIGERKPLLVPVHAEEASGRNSLPAVYAAELGDQLGLTVHDRIVQANRPMRTGEGAVYRLANRAEFAGDVIPGRDYFLVDDAVTQGGTLADLRSYIEQRGGKVIGATTLIASPFSHILAPQRKTLAALRDKLPQLEQWWKDNHGHGFEALTESELRSLHSFNSTDAVRNRLAAEGFAPDARRRGPGTGEGEGGQGGPGGPGGVDRGGPAGGRGPAGGVAAKPARGPKARPEQTWSLLEFLADRGGIRNDDPLIGDVRSSIGRSNKLVPGFGSLIRNPVTLSTAQKVGGKRAPMTLDQAREAAVEAGYLHDAGDAGDAGGAEAQTNVSTLLDAVDRELRGQRVYRQGNEPAGKGIDPDEERHRIEGALDGALEESGVDPATVTGALRARAVEIMHKEGESDALSALERAWTEEVQNGSEAGEFQRIADDIPGWDVPDDAGSNPQAGRPAGADGDAARQGAGDGRAAAGVGDRAAGRDAAGRGVADWDRLKQAAPEDEDLVAASHDAKAEPEPASINPDKSPTAAEQAAKEADALLADILPTLSDEERAIFEDALEKLDQEKSAREQIVREGAACLAAAVA